MGAVGTGRLVLVAVILGLILAVALVMLRFGRPPGLPWAAATPVREQTGLMEQTSRVHSDQRFYLYVPRSYDGAVPFRLLVVMHGYERRVEAYAQQFAAFADEHRYVLLAPVFERPRRYQQLGIGDDSVRADLRLLDLVEEVGGRYRLEPTFDLFGFSAGGQFAHRFLYVHPQRLRSVVTAAPGTVTLPSERDRWPRGLGDLDRLADVRVDLDRVRQVRTMLIVGEEDVGAGNLNDSMEANRFGQTRLARARTLHEAWQDASIDHEYVEVTGLSHVLDERIAAHARRFLTGG